MADVKIKCLNSHRFGQKVSLPLIGEVVIPADGILEVDESVASALLNGGNKNYQILGDLNEDDEDDSDTSVETKKVSRKSKKDDKKAKKEVILDEDDSDEDDSDEDDSDEDDSDEDDSDEDETDEDETDSLQDLEKLELDELVDMAKELGHKEKEYSKFAKSKKLMINFLKKN